MQQGCTHNIHPEPLSHYCFDCGRYLCIICSHHHLTSRSTYGYCIGPSSQAQDLEQWLLDWADARTCDEEGHVPGMQSLAVERVQQPQLPAGTEQELPDQQTVQAQRQHEHAAQEETPEEPSQELAQPQQRTEEQGGLQAAKEAPTPIDIKTYSHTYTQSQGQHEQLAQEDELEVPLQEPDQQKQPKQGPGTQAATEDPTHICTKTYSQQKQRKQEPGPQAARDAQSLIGNEEHDDDPTRTPMERWMAKTPSASVGDLDLSELTQIDNHSLTQLPRIPHRATIAVSEPTSLSGGLSTLKPSITIDAPCGVCALASSPEQCHVHNAETCLGNRPQEASDELLDIRVETGADCGAEPDAQ